MDRTGWTFPLNAPFDGGAADQKTFFGGKGTALRQLQALGIPTPPAFIIPTTLCTAFYANKKAFPANFKDQLEAALKDLEAKSGLRLGDVQNPLLLSVRSGARASMPGMMDTILNLGLNDQTAEGLAQKTGDARFAFDSYRRFIQMYSNVVLDLGLQPFEDILAQYRSVRGAKEDSDLSADDLKAITAAYLKHVASVTGEPFPQDTRKQLQGAIGAVLRSWMNKRAVTYRSLYGIPETWGTAVIVQAMVFGNWGDDSGTGVAFTRNPATGEDRLYGEYLVKAQGEDVVAGIRTPLPLSAYGQTADGAAGSLEKRWPDLYDQLVAVRGALENHFQDMQDIEFTIQRGKLWILQTRNGKRTARAGLKIARDMVSEGLLSENQAIQKVQPQSLDQMLHPRLADTSKLSLLGTGLPASPGAAVGRIAFSSDECLRLVDKGEPALLVRDETSPEDIEGMDKAFGIITACGGMTSHAAVVARGMGKPCIVGFGDMVIDHQRGMLSVAGKRLQAGQFLSLDGASGQIFEGRAGLLPPEPSEDFNTFMGWADAGRRMRVRANADTPLDVKRALSMGAEGVGLCRTEHMFFENQRILAMRQMILADSPEAKADAADKMFPMQRDDFYHMMKALSGRPFTVRLLDPPLHEFLPQGEAEIDQLASALGLRTQKVHARLVELKEANPMLGNRGCRLGITMPAVYEMQVRALVSAALQDLKDQKQKPEDRKAENAAGVAGQRAPLEIMVPLISLAGEFRLLRSRLEKVISSVLADPAQNPDGFDIDYQIGCMIELPRAALKANKIALHADFLSFGTNDLTQTTFGFSRDDVGSFLGTYRRKGILERDPFVCLDQSGVGQLIRIAVEKARSVKPKIKMGVCGEQGADPASVQFFESLGLDYISCSPYRVPIARLAAAQSTSAAS